MPDFPLHVRPKESYKEPPRCFGSSRDHGARTHAGCDLYAQAGTEVLAVEDGQVVRGPYLFYDVVHALEVQHPSGGKMQTVAQSMLHLELFAGTAQGPLTDRNHPPFMRRGDLVDPTAFLDSCTEVNNATT